MPDSPVIATVVRDGFVESCHAGRAAIVDGGGAALAVLGEAGAPVYPRSALKPLQATASLEALVARGRRVEPLGLAVASASHEGSVAQQLEVAHLLALAGLDERALRCPEARPVDPEALTDEPAPTRLAHNCSGKHAAFLYAHCATGGDPVDYLEPQTVLQRRVREVIECAAGTALEGPGTDGCGAPAWRLPLTGLAGAFAALAAGRGALLARVRDAMIAWPHLVGGAGAADTALMRAQPGVVAKRGAEGVLAAGWVGPDGPRGVAVKVADGAGRATGPVVATVLAGLGARVPDEVRWPPVLGGGEPHGHVAATAAVEGLASAAR